MSAPARPSLLTVPNVVFSMKMFAASMLAYWIALRFNLDQPYWAAGCVYLVSNPLSGASTSKAVYRLLGTMIGGVMSVILLPNLVNAPELMALAMASWVGFCLFVSFLDRSPRSYTMMLAGYTALIISFRIVSTPGEIFLVATDRVQEIGLGVICAALVNRLILPVHAGPVLFGRVTAWLGNAGHLAAETLRGHGDEATALAERRRLAADAVEMRAFTTHVGYDTSHHRDLVGLAHVLQQRMVAFLPALSAIRDQLAGLERAGADPGKLHALAEQTAAWLTNQGPVDTATGERLLSDLAEIEAQPRRDWGDFLRGALAERMIELIRGWLDCSALRDAIAGHDHDSGRVAQLLRTATPYRAQRDYLTAAIAGLAAAATVLLFAAFWIATGWSYGAAGMQVAGVFCCILASIDNPVPALRKFLIYMLWAALAGFIYNYLIFPHFTQYSSVVAALGLYLIPAGILMTRPDTMLVGLTLCVNLPYDLTLSSRLSLDFQAYLENNISFVLAMACAILCTRLIRSIGAEAAARRVLQQAWARIATIAATPRPAAPLALIQELTDAFGLATPRLAQIPASAGALASDLIRDLRVGLNVLSLQTSRAALPEAARAPLDRVLALTARYYSDRARGQGGDPAALLAAVDRCIGAAEGHASARLSHRISTGLAGLRMGIDPDAPPPQLASLPRDHAA